MPVERREARDCPPWEASCQFPQCLSRAGLTLQPPSQPRTPRFACLPLTRSCFPLSSPPALETQALDVPGRPRALGSAL